MAGETTDPIDVDVPSGDESEPVTAKKKVRRRLERREARLPNCSSFYACRSR